MPPDIAPEDLLRVLLDRWQHDIGSRGSWSRRTNAGKDFYEVLTLASIVERETPSDTEKPKIAGAYTNRLNPKRRPTGVLNSEPTVVYAKDTIKLRALEMDLPSGSSSASGT